MSIAIADMENFVGNMGSSDIQISSNIGNVIELGDEDLGNDFGASMLSNSRITARPVQQSSSQSVSALEPLQDIKIGS